MDKPTIKKATASWITLLFAATTLLMSGCLSSSDDDEGGSAGPSNEASVDIEIEEDEWEEYELDLPEGAEHLEVVLSDITEGGASMRVSHATGSCGRSRTSGEGTCEYEDPNEGSWTIRAETFHDEGPAAFTITAIVEPDDLEIELEKVGSGAAAKSLANLESEGSGKPLDAARARLPLLKQIIKETQGKNAGYQDFAIKDDDRTIGTASVLFQEEPLMGQMALTVELNEARLKSANGEPILFDKRSGEIRGGQVSFRNGDGHVNIRLGDDTGTQHAVEMMDGKSQAIEQTDWGQEAKDTKLVRE